MSNEPDFTCLLLKGMQEVNECRRLRRQRRRSEDEAKRVDYYPELTKFGSQDLGTETKDKQRTESRVSDRGQVPKAPNQTHTEQNTKQISHLLDRYKHSQCRPLLDLDLSLWLNIFFNGGLGGFYRFICFL